MWSKDWITRFLEYTSGQKSPEIFRQWTAISLISSCLERRCWSESLEGKPAYPNQYIMLVARPGRGKEIIKVGEEMLRELTGSKYGAKLKLGSHDLTTSSLIDEIAASQQMNIGHTDIHGRQEQYAYLSAFAEELGVFLKTFDNTFITTMTAFWNNYSSFQQTRRTGNLKIDIINPSLNLLIGATPRALGEVLPDVAWGMGFMGRMLMVYSDKEVKVKYFVVTSPAEKALKAAQRKDLLDDLNRITKIRGQFLWEEDAVALMQEWDDNGCKPRPKHSKLEDYCSRRTFFTIKLAMLAAISSHGKLIIYKEDYARARDWLLEIEGLMPDVFRAMVGRSDRDVIEEAHTFLWAMYTKSGNKPVPRAAAISFLKDRVPSEKIHMLIETMVSSDVVDEIEESGGLIPKPMVNHYGIE